MPHRPFPNRLRRSTRTVVTVAGLVLAALPGRPGSASAATEVGIPTRTPDGFEVAVPGREFRFPQDHGSHPGFRIEWWYVTGHLESAETQHRRFGFQATFFRRSAPGARTGTDISAAPEASQVPSRFGDDEIHLAHMALLDFETGRFVHEERWNRRGWDAATAIGRLDVRNGPWSLRALGRPVGAHTGRRTATAGGTLDADPIQLQGGVQASASWNLVLTPTKPLVVFGTNGVSRKAADPTAASHYLTWSRLATEGELTLDGKVLRVSGASWMDHEISSSQLGEGQVGWDWTGLQLDDGREIMAYRLRRADGTTDPASTLAWVDRDGRVTHLDPTRFRWRPEGVWKSPRSGGSYPAAALLEIDAFGGFPSVVLRLRPTVSDQELMGGAGGIPYWEGACEVLDTGGRRVGRAFLEMTGYAGDLTGALRQR